MADTSTLVFLDTEYTSLDSQFARVWNVGMIIRRPDGSEVAEELIIRDPDLTYADPTSLAIGHLWRRHPDFFGGDPGVGVELLAQDKAARWVLERLKPDIAPNGIAIPRHVVACRPRGDIEVLTELLRQNGLPWPAHYHELCAESIAIGALRARGIEVPVPFSAAWLAEQLGIEEVDPVDKHTALADARWAMRLYDAASQPSQPVSSALGLLLLERAWGIIANVDQSNWDNQSPPWKSAAETWRESYHEAIRHAA